MNMGRILKSLGLALLGAAVGVGIVIGTNQNRCNRVRRFFTGETNVLVYSSQDGRYRVVGPIWECARQVDGRSCYPVIVGCGESDGRAYWCHVTSSGSSGNFEVESEAGDFSLSDSSFCHSDEVKAWTYMTFASEGTTNKVILGRAGSF